MRENVHHGHTSHRFDSMKEAAMSPGVIRILVRSPSCPLSALKLNKCIHRRLLMSIAVTFLLQINILLRLIILLIPLFERHIKKRYFFYILWLNKNEENLYMYCTDTVHIQNDFYIILKFKWLSLWRMEHANYKIFKWNWIWLSFHCMP